MGGLAAFSGGAYTGIKNTPPVCFTAGTMVATVSGYTAIEQITAGDFVTATDEATGKTGYKKVVETYVNHTKELIHIGIGEEVIKTTPGHLIYVSGKGFTRADELKPDDKVINDKNKECLIVSIQREELDEEIPVYNMQVEDYHTYHVGKCGILVHNDCEREQSHGNEVTSASRVVTHTSIYYRIIVI